MIANIVISEHERPPLFRYEVHAQGSDDDIRKKILIVDDEESIRCTFYEFLTGDGYLVETTDTLSGCIKKMRTEQFDLLFLDIGLGHDNGIDAIEEVKLLQPDCEVVIITGSLDPKAINRARSCGASDYVVKPVYEASLRYLTQKALSH